MKVQQIDNNSFRAKRVKNTFLNKSKNALNNVDKAYYKSLHYEAKARLHYLKFQKAESELSTLENINIPNKPMAFIRIISKMIKEKFKSFVFSGDAYGEFPNRYAEPDSIKMDPIRYYKIKENYRNLI